MSTFVCTAYSLCLSEKPRDRRWQDVLVSMGMLCWQAAVRPVDMPKADFDFEEALAKFNKADLQQEQVTRPA